MLHIAISDCYRLQMNVPPHSSTEWASTDAGVKHRIVHIYLVTTVWKKLQST